MGINLFVRQTYCVCTMQVGRCAIWNVSAQYGGEIVQNIEPKSNYVTFLIEHL